MGPAWACWREETYKACAQCLVHWKHPEAIHSLVKVLKALVLLSVFMASTDHVLRMMRQDNW